MVPIQMNGRTQEQAEHGVSTCELAGGISYKGPDQRGNVMSTEHAWDIAGSLLLHMGARTMIGLLD